MFRSSVMSRVPRAIMPAFKMYKLHAFVTRQYLLPTGYNDGAGNPVWYSRPEPAFSTNSLYNIILSVGGVNTAVNYKGSKDIIGNHFNKYRIIASQISMSMVPKYDPDGAYGTFGQYVMGLVMEPRTINTEYPLSAPPNDFFAQPNPQCVVRRCDILQAKKHSISSYWSRKKFNHAAAAFDLEANTTQQPAIIPANIPQTQGAWFPFISKVDRGSIDSGIAVEITFKLTAIVYCWDRKWVEDI